MEAPFRDHVHQRDGEAERHGELEEVAVGGVIQRDGAEGQPQPPEDDRRPGGQAGDAAQRAGALRALGRRDRGREGEGSGVGGGDRARRAEGAARLEGVGHIGGRGAAGGHQAGPEKVEREVLHR